MSWKSGSLNLLKPSGPHRASYGIALLHVWLCNKPEVFNPCNPTSLVHEKDSSCGCRQGLPTHGDDMLGICLVDTWNKVVLLVFYLFHVTLSPLIFVLEAKLILCRYGFLQRFFLYITTLFNCYSLYDIRRVVVKTSMYIELVPLREHSVFSLEINCDVFTMQ